MRGGSLKYNSLVSVMNGMTHDFRTKIMRIFKMINYLVNCLLNCLDRLPIINLLREAMFLKSSKEMLHTTSEAITMPTTMILLLLGIMIRDSQRSIISNLMDQFMQGPRIVKCSSIR